MAGPHLVVILLLVAVAGCGKKDAEGESQAEPTTTVIAEDEPPARGARASDAEQKETVPVPPTRAVPKTVPTSRPAMGEYTVQAGAWHDRAKALRAAASLREQNFDAYVQRAYLVERDEVWHRVRIGGFETREAAMDEARMLKAAGTESAWVDRMRDDY